MSNAAVARLQRLHGSPVPVQTALPDALSDQVAAVLHGWTVSANAENDPPAVRLSLDGNGAYRVEECFGTTDYTVSDPVDAVCGLIAELLKYQANAVSEWLCLHAAAAIFQERAVLFPAGFRAGKSTLAAVFAASEIPVLGDDAVFVSPVEQLAVSPGISPRMRLPLPVSLSARSRDFIERCMRLKGKRYAYLDLPKPGQMNNGERAPIGAIVFLRRVDEGKPEFRDVAKSDALKFLILQNFARSAPAGMILERLYEIVASRPTLELRYANADDAVETLRERFADWPSNDVPADRTGGHSIAVPQLPDPEWHVKPGVAERQVEGSHFIADEDTGRIAFLNPTAAAIWRLLSEGESREGISALLATAFPDVDATQVAKDVEGTVRNFRDTGLLLNSEEYRRLYPDAKAAGG